MPRVARLGPLLVLASASLLVFVVGACSSSNGGSNASPPVFNAVDQSNVCPAGSVGWDFSTGGAAGVPTATPNALHIVSASLVDGVSQSTIYQDLTSSVTVPCEGQKACDVPFPTLPPKEGNTGYAVVVHYTCGGGGKTAVLYPGSDKDIHVQCGAAISLVSANLLCNGGKAGDVTYDVAPLVDGLDSVPVSQNLNGLGIYFQNENGEGVGQYCSNWYESFGLTVTYTCGTDPTQLVASASTIDAQNPGASDYKSGALSFSCPWQADPTPLPGLVITNATYGANCESFPGNTVTAGNFTATFEKTCDGNLSCQRQTVTPGDINDPAPNCAKNLALTYHCGNTNDALVVVPAEAHDSLVSLQCGLPIHIVDASYGANANAALKGNFTARASASCENTVRCQPGANASQGAIATSTALFGSDPAPNFSKQWTFDYTCGSDPTLRTQTFQQTDVIDFQCPPQTPPTPQAWAIHVTSANDKCTDFTTLVDDLQNLCFGKSVCNVPYDRTTCSQDPLSVTWQCGNDPTAHTTTIAAPTKGADLSAIACAPPIEVLSAKYGNNCPGADAGPLEGGAARGDVTATLASACSGVAATCAYVLNGLGDPFPGCAKDFDVEYSCGTGTTALSAHVPGEAAGKTVTLSCPTGQANTKTCVPQNCTGFARRDISLNCVNDNSLPVLPAFTSWNVQLSPHGAPGVTTLIKGQPADLSLSVQLAAPGVPEALIGQQAAKATVVLVDNFTQKPGQTGTTGPKSVTGVRCIIAHPGLSTPTTQTADGGTTPGAGSPDVLTSTQSNLLIPPECFPLANTDGTPSGNQLLSWKDAALRANVSFDAFQSAYTMDAQTYLLVLFDEQGETVALRTPGTASDNALVPNPVGFFYDSQRSWVDLVSYYEQTQLPLSLYQDSNNKALSAGLITLGLGPAVTLSRSNDIQYIANSGTLRTAQFDASPSAAQATLYMDFNWAMYDDPQNPFSPETNLVAGTAAEIWQALAAVVEITTDTAYKAAGNQWPTPENTMLLTPQQFVPHLSNGSPTGKTDQLVLPIPAAVKQRILTPNTQVFAQGTAGTTEYGWLDPNNLLMSTYHVRICLASEGSDPVNHSFSSSAQVGQVKFGAVASSPSNCIIVPQTLLVTRSDLRVRPAPSPAISQGFFAQSGQSADKGDSNSSNSQDMGTVAGCGTPATISASQTDCATAGRSTATTISSTAGGGTGSHQLFQTTSNTTQTTTSGASSSAEGTAEIEGYQVFSDDTSQAGTDPEYAHEIKLAPNYAGLVKAFNASEDEDPEPVKFSAETETFSGGENGIGLGVGIDVHLEAGPIPIEVELSVSVGVGLSLVLKYDDPVPYPCMGGSAECFQAYADSQTQDGAATECSLKGGQLAQILLPADWQTVTSLSNLTDPNYWIGAQESYEYNTLSCIANPQGSGCASNVDTFYEWLYSVDPTNPHLPLTFAASIAGQPGYYNADALAQRLTSTVPNFGGTVDALFVSGMAPNPAGVVYAPGSGPSDRALGSALRSSKFPYICGFAPGGSLSVSNNTAVEPTLTVAAGENFSVCVPSDIVGVCVSLGVNFVQGELGFEFADAQTIVTDPKTNMLTQISGRRSRDITWSIGFMQGEMSATVDYLFGSTSWTIFEFGPTPYGGTLYQNDGEPYRSTFQ